MTNDDKVGARIMVIRRVFAWTTIASAAFMTLCLALLASTKALKLDEAVSRVVFECLYGGALGFFVSTVARFCLDIMYGLFGLLQVKILRLLAWFALSIFSLLPLAAIYAFLRLAAGFQA